MLGRRACTAAGGAGACKPGRKPGWRGGIYQGLAALLACCLAAAVHAEGIFQGCLQFFAHGRPPDMELLGSSRALCFDSFAVLHSGESRTPVYVAERLNRQALAGVRERRGYVFHADARLAPDERASPQDYAGSGYDRGHMAPAADMATPEAMAQSFSLANAVPQAPEHNRGTWARTVERATRRYVDRAAGDVYVITGPVFLPDIARSPSIGAGRVHVPAVLYKLVYDPVANRAWAYWQENDNATRGSRPISYAELVLRTGIDFLPGASPGD